MIFFDYSIIRRIRDLKLFPASGWHTDNCFKVVERNATPNLFEDSFDDGLAKQPPRSGKNVYPTRFSRISTDFLKYATRSRSEHKRATFGVDLIVSRCVTMKFCHFAQGRCRKERQRSRAQCISAASQVLNATDVGLQRHPRFRAIVSYRSAQSLRQ